MPKKICVCVQARLSSERLPGKVLKKVSQLNLLELLVKRLLKAKNSNQIFILTSNDVTDNRLVKFCEHKGLNFFRGELHNVYKRFRDFLKMYEYHAIVRISADSPLLDYITLVKMINLFLKNNFDIVTNVFPKTFPSGQSIEIIDRNCFLNLPSNKLNKSQKEHVTKYFYENKKFYNIFNVTCDYSHSNIKLSVDTLDDFEKLKKALSYRKINENSSINEILENWNDINE